MALTLVTDLHPKIGKSLNYIIKRLKNLKRDCATDTVLVWNEKSSLASEHAGQQPNW